MYLVDKNSKNNLRNAKASKNVTTDRSSTYKIPSDAAQSLGFDSGPTDTDNSFLDVSEYLG